MRPFFSLVAHYRNGARERPNVSTDFACENDSPPTQGGLIESARSRSVYSFSLLLRSHQQSSRTSRPTRQAASSPQSS
ncbi:hypothetical protein DP57_6043 [Burkholderia pseudomallei]|nr:hypothetical protein DP57_6043 [Burkholderia pseudomallei]